MADFGEGEILESLDIFRNRLEDILDVMDFVFVAGDGADQVADRFPIVSALAGRIDRAVEALEATGEVHHRAAFFRESGGGQHEMRTRCGRVGERVKLHEKAKL